MNFLPSKLLPHHRHLVAATIPSLSPLLATITPKASSKIFANAIISNNFHTSAALSKNGRNQKIGITLEQLRMAARGHGRRLPICHAEQEKVMNALEAAKYENSAIYKYVKEYDTCREEYELHHKGKDKIMMRELNNYLVRKRKRK